MRWKVSEWNCEIYKSVVQWWIKWNFTNRENLNFKFSNAFTWKNFKWKRPFVSFYNVHVCCLQHLENIFWKWKLCRNSRKKGDHHCIPQIEKCSRFLWFFHIFNSFQFFHKRRRRRSKILKICGKIKLVVCFWRIK